VSKILSKPVEAIKEVDDNPSATIRKMIGKIVIAED
jgi:hypothetical protein